MKTRHEYSRALEQNLIKKGAISIKKGDMIAVKLNNHIHRLQVTKVNPITFYVIAPDGRIIKRHKYKHLSY